MKFTIVIALSFLCIFCIFKHYECARILAVVATSSYSHQITYTRLWLELNKRGHEIVFITTDYIPALNVPNITQILIKNNYEVLKGLDFIRFRFEGISWLNFMKNTVRNIGSNFSEYVFNNPTIMELYAPNSIVTFDVVMVEMLWTPALYALAHRFNAPLIGLSSLGLPAIHEYTIGGLVLPSHESTWEMESYTGSNLPFWKRLRNFLTMWHSVYDSYWDIFVHQQTMAEKYLGKNIPSLYEMAKNVSVIFVNQDEVLSFARLKLPNLITFSTLHISDNPLPLSKKLKRFVDGAKNGFIYFNLGTNVQSSLLPRETIQVFLDVFAKLPYKVLWKFEKELPEKPDNVFTASWFPQQTILAHPNIKLFIYQGGVQSTEEAVHFAIPLLGIPILADQDHQTIRMKSLGVAKVLEVTTLKRDELENAIIEIITNKEYKENMLKVRNLAKDTPYDFAGHLAWWTEFVIRHKGAPHLRSTLVRQPWYQYCDMDVVIFLTVVIYIVFSNAIGIIIKFAVYTYKRYFPVEKQKTS